MSLTCREAATVLLGQHEAEEDAEEAEDREDTLGIHPDTGTLLARLISVEIKICFQNKFMCRRVKKVMIMMGSSRNKTKCRPLRQSG